MIKGIFITGTDTGVGKTYVAAGIARALRRQDHDISVGVMKPAETGCPSRGGSLVPKDALALMAAAGADDPLDLVNPYRFREPLAPWVASARSGTTIDLRKIVSSYGKLEKRHDLMIVEGAGGIVVPLTARRSFLDLAALLKLPVLIVARPGLGTINHTLLTVLALRQRGLKIAGIVINYAMEQQRRPAERTNPGIIESRSGVRVIGVVPFGRKDIHCIAATLCRLR